MSYTSISIPAPIFLHPSTYFLLKSIGLLKSDAVAIPFILVLNSKVPAFIVNISGCGLIFNKLSLSSNVAILRAVPYLLPDLLTFTPYSKRAPIPFPI